MWRNSFHRLLTDYEDLPLSFDNEGNVVEMPEPRGYEIMKLPSQVYEDKYGGLDCPCKCHECDIKRYQLRLEHCVPCGIRFVDGKVCLKSDKKLKALDADDMRCILTCHTSPSDVAQAKKHTSKTNIQVSHRVWLYSELNTHTYWFSRACDQAQARHDRAFQTDT